MGRSDRDAAWAALEEMKDPQRRELALALAAAASPFGELDGAMLGLSLDETDRLLGAVPDDALGEVEVDRIRHMLWSVPAMSESDEPAGASWFAFGALVAHIYAADALTTSPTDGPRHTFQRLEDLLDYAEELLARSDLRPLLYRAVAHPNADGYNALRAGIENAAKALAEQGT